MLVQPRLQQAIVSTGQLHAGAALYYTVPYVHIPVPVDPWGVSHPVDLHPLDSSGVGVHRVCRSAQCQRVSQKVINFGGRILVSSIYVRIYISGGEVRALANCPVIYICGVNPSGGDFLESLSVRKGSISNP